MTSTPAPADMPVADSPEVTSVASATEAKLAEIIFAARRIAVLAEEVMRETITTGTKTGGHSIMHNSPELAVRLLTATEEQLTSILALSRQDAE